MQHLCSRYVVQALQKVPVILVSSGVKLLRMPAAQATMQCVTTLHQAEEPQGRFHTLQQPCSSESLSQTQPTQVGIHAETDIPQMLLS